MSRSTRLLVFYVAVLALACLISSVVYRWTDADCRARGGPTEMVYSRTIGWTCSGARR